jgi:hypothetical protein
LLVIWDIFPVLVCCTKKNLATLVCSLFELRSICRHQIIFPVTIKIYFVYKKGQKEITLKSRCDSAYIFALGKKYSGWLPRPGQPLKPLMKNN